MPRKPKVTAVPVEQEPLSEGSTEPKTDAEQMTDIINEVSVTEPILLNNPTHLPHRSRLKRRQSEHLHAAQACASQKSSNPKWWSLLPSTRHKLKQHSLSKRQKQRQRSSAQTAVS